MHISGAVGHTSDTRSQGRETEAISMYKTYKLPPITLGPDSFRGEK